MLVIPAKSWVFLPSPSCSFHGQIETYSSTTAIFDDSCYQDCRYLGPWLFSALSLIRLQLKKDLLETM